MSFWVCAYLLMSVCVTTAGWENMCECVYLGMGMIRVGGVCACSCVWGWVCGVLEHGANHWALLLIWLASACPASLPTPVGPVLQPTSEITWFSALFSASSSLPAWLLASPSRSPGPV